MRDQYFFLSGAVMFGAWVAGAFFFRFWKQTHDRLFFWFGMSFWIMTLERLVLLVAGSPAAEDHPTIYLIRFFAYLLIIYAVIGKNVGKRGA